MSIFRAWPTDITKLRTQIAQAQIYTRLGTLSNITSSPTNYCELSGRRRHATRHSCRLQEKMKVKFPQLQDDFLPQTFDLSQGENFQCILFFNILRHWPVLKFQIFKRLSFPPVMSLEKQKMSAMKYPRKWETFQYPRYLLPLRSNVMHVMEDQSSASTNSKT